MFDRFLGNIKMANKTSVEPWWWTTLPAQSENPWHEKLAMNPIWQEAQAVSDLYHLCPYLDFFFLWGQMQNLCIGMFGAYKPLFFFKFKRPETRFQGYPIANAQPLFGPYYRFLTTQNGFKVCGCKLVEGLDIWEPFLFQQIHGK